MRTIVWLAVLLATPVFAQTPYTMSLSPSTLTAGGPGFSLTVSFAGNSTLLPTPAAYWVIRWNGSPRPTHYISTAYSPAEVQADISAADIAQPGFAEVSVLDTEHDIVYPVVGYFVTTVNVAVADFAYDSLRNRFYVTVPTGQGRPNAPAETVVSVDAATGAIGQTLTVGSKPTWMAVSDDDSYLYVYLSGTASIARVALASFTPDITFSLAGTGPALLAMEAMPGSPHIIGVVQTTTEGNAGQVVLYRDGVDIGSTPATMYASSLLFADNTTIITGSYGGSMYTVTVGPGGIVSEAAISGTNEQEMPLAASGGTLFTSSGRLYDLATLQLVGETGTSGSATFVPGQDRLLVLWNDNNGGGHLQAFDQGTATAFGQMSVGSASTAGIGSSQARLVAWGTDGLAFVASQTLFIGHTPLAGPAPVWTAAGTVNAASQAAGPIAPGEIISIYGSNLGLAAGRSLEFSAYNKVSTNLGGTEVWFDGLAGTMVYAGAGQVNLVVPFGLAGKSSAEVQLWYGGIPSAQVSLPLTALAPAIFTQNASGSGLGAVVNADGTINGPSQPAIAGTWAVAFGTGGGNTQQPSEDGVPATSADWLVATTRVLLNGQPVPVLYAGAAPELVPGAVQVDFQIPAGFPSSASVSLQVEIGGVASSPAVTMAVK
jgi:uncharacterized protein (TIGR03437 family)